MIPFTEQIKLIDGGAFAGVKVRDECPACYHFSPHIDDPGRGYRCKVKGSCPAVDLTPQEQEEVWRALDASAGAP